MECTISYEIMFNQSTISLVDIFGEEIIAIYLKSISFLGIQVKFEGSKCCKCLHQGKTQYFNCIICSIVKNCLFLQKNNYQVFKLFTYS